MNLSGLPACWKFRREHPDEWKSFGCGPGGFGDRLVPDTMYGLYIGEACRVHDWEYRLNPNRSKKARKDADNRLRNNLILIVKYKSKRRTVKFFRLIRCRTYYIMVRAFGAGSWAEAKSVRDRSKT